MNKVKNFRNEVNIPEFDIDIDHNRPILSFGSCFSNEMHQLLMDNGFGAIYPYGTIYNPITIADNLNRIFSNKPFKDSDLTIYNEEIWFSWFHSGKNFDVESQNLLDKINNEQVVVSDKLISKPLIIVTLGSSIVFSLKNSNTIVANCHKQPSEFFDKKRLEINDVVDAWSPIINDLDADFIFAVSPVRHYRSGMVENNRSKSVLLLAVERLCNLYPSKAKYFPSYEIMMDELRDYRFYGRDWVHPSEEAVSYIWNKFSQSLFSSSVLKVINDVSNIKLRINHQPNYGMTSDHIKFLQKLKKDIVNIKGKTPLYNWSKEIKSINSLIE